MTRYLQDKKGFYLTFFNVYEIWKLRKAWRDSGWNIENEDAILWESLCNLKRNNNENKILMAALFPSCKILEIK